MGKSNFVIPVFLPQAGCPFKCIYCNQNKITGVDNAMPSNLEIEHRIRSYLKTIGTRAKKLLVAFYGGTFTGIPLEEQQRLLNVVKQFRGSGIQGIRISTKPDCVDRKNLAVIKQYGVTQIELGIQSLHDDVLKQSKRGYTAEQVRIASNLIREQGFLVGHQFMIGLPGDNWQRLIHTVQSSNKLMPDMIRIYPTLIMQGTALEHLKGYQPLSLAEAIERARFMLEFFEYNSVRILRVGLHPPNDVTSIIAGPYHPSFRSLVLSDKWGEFIKDVIRRYGRVIKIFISRAVHSHVVGFQQQNLSLFADKSEIVPVKWLHEDAIVLKTPQKTVMLDRREYRKRYLTAIVKNYGNKSIAKKICVV